MTDPVATFEGELRRFVARRVPGPDADDVLQDTLLRIHLGVASLRSRERLAPWVYRVAKSAIVDHHRRRRPAAPVDEPDGDDPSGDTREMLAACLTPFMASLPAEQAEALRLTDLGGLSQVDAAARLGVPLPTLKSRVQRGRRKLREELEACCALARDGRGRVVEATPRCGCG